MNITVKVGDLGTVVTGNTPPRSNPEFYGNYIPFIKATDISEGEKYTYNPEEYYSEEGFQKYKTSLIPKNSTCVVTIGSIGKKMTMACQDCFINQAMNAIIPNDNYDNEYVYYLLKNSIHKLKNLDSGTASGRENVSKSAFMSMELSVVKDKAIQKKIGSILSAYDDLIENNQKQIKLLEEAAQRLYKEWFVDLRFPGHEGVKVVDGVPEGWSSDQLIKLAEFKRGKTITKSSVKEGNVPVIAGGLEPAYFHNVANTVAPVITVSASGANAGYTALHNHNVWASDCSFIDSKICEHIYYVYNFLKTNKNMMLNLQKGSAQPHVYAKNINELILLIPEEKVLKEYSNKVEVIYKAIFHKSKQISSLREARDRLLPKLMSGEIEV